MEPFDPLKTFLALGVALRNLLAHFPDLEPQRLPFVPKDLDGVNKELKEKVGVSIFYGDSKFEVGSGLELPTDPHIGVLAEFSGEVTAMDRITALTEYARAMTALCEATVTEGIEQDGRHLRGWEGNDHRTWAQSGCCFFDFDFPDTMLGEREAIAAALGFDAVAFHFGKMFVYFFQGDPSEGLHKNTLFVLNWRSNLDREDLEPEQIFFWTKKQVNTGKLFAFLYGLKKPPCWFLKSRWIRRKAAPAGGFILTIG